MNYSNHNKKKTTVSKSFISSYNHLFAGKRGVLCNQDLVLEKASFVYYCDYEGKHFCISSWGSDFRTHFLLFLSLKMFYSFSTKSFTDLPMENCLLVKDLFLSVPIIALTLTAPPSVKSDIIS